MKNHLRIFVCILLIIVFASCTEDLSKQLQPFVVNSVYNMKSIDSYETAQMRGTIESKLELAREVRERFGHLHGTETKKWDKAMEDAKFDFPPDVENYDPDGRATPVYVAEAYLLKSMEVEGNINEQDDSFVCTVEAAISEKEYKSKMVYMEQNPDMIDIIANQAGVFETSYQEMRTCELLYEMREEKIDILGDMLQEYYDMEDFHNAYQVADQIEQLEHQKDQDFDEYQKLLEKMSSDFDEIHSVAETISEKVETKLAKSSFGKKSSSTHPALQAFLDWQQDDMSNKERYLSRYETTHGSRALEEKYWINMNAGSAGEMNELMQRSLAEDPAFQEKDPSKVYDCKVNGNVAEIAISEKALQERFKAMRKLPMFQDPEVVAIMEESLRDSRYYMYQENGRWKRYLCEGDRDYEKYGFWQSMMEDVKIKMQEH